MKKMGKIGLLSMLTVGAVGLSGAVCLRNRDLENGWKRCELYVESPEYPAIVQKVLDKIPVGIDGQTLEHPENSRVYCTNWHYPNKEEVHNSCYTQLTSIEEFEKKGLNAELSEELISPDRYKFSSLNLRGFEKNPKRLREIIGNSPWIFEAARNGGYVFSNLRDDNGSIVERHYELANGKKIAVVDSNRDGILDRYMEN